MTVKDAKFANAEPPEAVIHINIHPRDFSKNCIVTRDDINFFKSQDHVDIRESAFPEKRGGS
jgi:hypothetical protein